MLSVIYRAVCTRKSFRTRIAGIAGGSGSLSSPFVGTAATVYVGLAPPPIPRVLSEESLPISTSREIFDRCRSSSSPRLGTEPKALVPVREVTFENEKSADIPSLCSRLPREKILGRQILSRETGPSALSQ